MLPYVIRRILTGALLLLVISFLTYMLLSIPDQDVGRSLLGLNAADELVAAKNQSLGLDQPAIVQYGAWLKGALTGDLGSSWFTSAPVGPLLAARLPVTLSLVLGVTLVTTLASFALGIWAGVRGGVVDKFVQAFAVFGYALPGFLVTLFLVIIFAVKLGWFPAIGYIRPTQSVLGWLSTITLPVIALSISAVAGTAQQVRSAVIDVMGQDYVRTLRTRKLSARRILWRHVLRNAAPPSITVIGLQFVGLLGGAVIVEYIFGLPGIGDLTVQYTVKGDIPVIMGLLMLTVIGVVLVNLAVDLIIGVLNPKVRFT